MSSHVQVRLARPKRSKGTVVRYANGKEILTDKRTAFDATQIGLGRFVGTTEGFIDQTLIEPLRAARDTFVGSQFNQARACAKKTFVVNLDRRKYAKQLVRNNDRPEMVNAIVEAGILREHETARLTDKQLATLIAECEIENPWAAEEPLEVQEKKSNVVTFEVDIGSLIAEKIQQVVRPSAVLEEDAVIA